MSVYTKQKEGGLQKVSYGGTKRPRCITLAKTSTHTQGGWRECFLHGVLVHWAFNVSSEERNVYVGLCRSEEKGQKLGEQLKFLINFEIILSLSCSTNSE